jgi:hypothetical protein
MISSCKSTFEKMLWGGKVNSELLYIAKLPGA